MKLSPALFLVLEFFMIFPSVLFLLGVVSYSLIQNILIVMVGPFAGGFLAYNYLEKYRPKRYLKTFTKLILAYSITEIGLVTFSSIIPR